MQNTVDLPDDIDALKAMILASQAEVLDRDALLEHKNALIERKEDCIQRLEKLVADFKRALFGARSEKVDREQYELSLEDIETAMAAVQPASHPRRRLVRRSNILPNTGTGSACS